MAAETTYLSAEEAASYLGVSRPTLYAYVSRGLIASEPTGSSSRAHRYLRSALEELKASRERRRDPTLKAHGALISGTPGLDSALTLIADGRLYYRGRDACELSRTETLEEVASLLWTGSTEGADGLFPRTASKARVGRKGASLPDRLVDCLIKGRSEPPVTIVDASAPTLRAAARAIRGLFDAVGAVGTGTLAERLARGWATPSAADLNAAMILCADHELNASSFTARCVASTDAPMHNVLLAAFCALEGRRHGGAASERIEALLRDAERDGAHETFRRTLAEHGWMPGFRHLLYPDGDPRARELLERIELPRRDPGQAIIKHAREVGVRPTLELALAILARRADLPPRAAFTLFALGRSVGWVAHALEAAADGQMIRPRARYIGVAPEPATSTSSRDGA